MAMNFSSYLDEARDGRIGSDWIKGLLAEFEPYKNRMIANLGRYEAAANSVPIFKRLFDDKNAVNNKMNNDYFSEIVDLKAGYFAGSPVAYQYDKTMSEAERAEARMNRFILDNHLADLDAESTKDAAICGYSARLLYVDERDGQEQIINLRPYECIFLSDRGINSPEYAVRHYSVKRPEGDRLRVEVYDAKGVRVFYEINKGTFVEADDEYKANLFGVCQLFGIPNNEELLGDADKVLELIDAYDRTLSDVNSEIESFRLAYMYFKGGQITAEDLRKAKQMGAFEVPEDGEMGYITKHLDDAVVEHHLNRLHANIYRFSKTPDLADEAFAGQQSGVALKYKLFPLETKCKSFERKFQTAILHMFRGLCNAWALKGEKFDPLNFYSEFKRTFPLDLLNEAQTQAELKGLVSEETRLSQASFIDDPSFEMERMEQEAMGVRLYVGDNVPEAPRENADVETASPATAPPGG